MKKVTVFIGSARKKATYMAAQEFEKCLKSYGEFDFEYVFLKDYHLDYCQGCKLCFDKGEEYCPLKDDRDLLLAKMDNSDGVIFASPNYAFQVSAQMKNFLDRIAFILHRPRFFSKSFTAIVTQGFFGGKDILKYLETMGENIGFNVTKGSCLQTLEPMTELQKKKLPKKIQKAAKRFYKCLNHSVYHKPSLFRLMIFRMTRTSLQSIDAKYRDYFYYKEKGWFKSDYYYNIDLGPIKKTVGCFFDYLGHYMAKHI